MGDVFFDCTSDDEREAQLRRPEGILRNVHGDSTNHCCLRKKEKYNDPMAIQKVLKRAANNAQILLRGLGDCRQCADALESQISFPNYFYPATLKITAQVHADSSCCPPHKQCILRGSPVSLNLPLELNPQNGHVKVNIFHPKQNALPVGEGLAPNTGSKRASSLAPSIDRRPSYRNDGSRKTMRRVRWDA